MVVALGIREMVEVWEAGRTRHPIDRAVLLLACGLEDRPEAAIEPARWPLGARDAALLRMRQAMFGDRFEVRADCPQCGEVVEFGLTCADLLAAAPERPATEVEVEVEGYRVRMRLPDSADLAAMSAESDVQAAVLLLLQRCVLQAVGPDGDVEAGILPEPVLAELGRRAETEDPAAEFRFALTCPACDAAWDATLDVPGLLWADVSQRARQALLEVDTIARVYGWSEEQILSLPPARRQTYVELAQA